MIAMNSLIKYFATGICVLVCVSACESTPLASASHGAPESKIQSSLRYDAEVVLQDDGSGQSVIDKLVFAKRHP